MRMSVNAATQVVIDSGMRFRSVNTSKGGADLTRLRDELLEELHELDQRIDCLGALLPKEAVIEEEPLQYDASKPFLKLIFFSSAHGFASSHRGKSRQTPGSYRPDDGVTGCRLQGRHWIGNKALRSHPSNRADDHSAGHVHGSASRR
jgi:hypothetical protein